MADADTSLNREHLMQQIEASWNDLQTYLAALTEEQLTQPTDAAGWTVKDHVIHIGMWEQAGLALLEGRTKREELNIPPEIWEQDDDADGTNEILQQRYQDMPLDEVMRTINEVHGRMMQKLETMTEEDLQRPYRHYQPHSTEERPIILWIMSDTIHHYHEHIPWIKAIVEKA